MGNPWNSIVTTSIMFMVLGLLTGWIYLRVNNSRVYFRLSLILIIEAVYLFLFFRGEQPHPLLFVIEGLLALALLVLGNAFLACVLVKLLPKVGIDEAYFINLEDGSLRRSFMFFSSIFFLMLCSFIFKNTVAFLGQLVGNSYLIFLLILIPVLAIISFYYMPWRTEEETLLLGQERSSVSLDDIFSVTGHVTRAEVIIFPLMALTAWILIIFLGKTKRAGVDFFGIFMFIALTYMIIRGELQRAKRNRV